MAGPWDPVDSSQPTRPPQPQQRTTPAATALGGTTGPQPVANPRAPQAAAGAGALAQRPAAPPPPPGEWDVVSTAPAPPEAREVGFAESAARTAGAATQPVVRTLGLAVGGVLQQLKGVAQLADQIAPVFGLQSDVARRVQEAQDRVFQQSDQLQTSMRDVYNPRPGEEFNTAGAITGGVLSMPVEVAGGMGVQRGIERSADVLQRGGSGTEAAVAGVVTGGANVAANALPIKVGGKAGAVIEQGLGKVLPGGARTGAITGAAATGGALGAGADIGVAAAENAALPEGEAFQDLRREAEPAVSGGLGAALAAGATAIATRGKGRAPRAGAPAPAAPGADAPPGSAGAAGTDVETQRRERARNLPVGIELTKGQASRDFEQQQFERETAKDGKTGEKLRKTYADQNERVTANLDALFELTGAEMPDVRGAGKRVVEAVAKRAAEVKGEVDAEYQRAREAGQMAEEVDTTALVTKLRDIAPSATNAGVIKTAEAELIRLGGAQRAEDGSLVPGRLSVDALEELRKTVGVGGRKDATNAHFANEIKQSIDMATDAAGGDIYRSARAKYRAYAEEFKNRKIVADLINTKRGTDERRVALEDVHKRTIKDGSVEEITKLRDTLRGAGLDGQQAWRELQGQTIAEIRDAALRNRSLNERGQTVVSAAGMNRVIKNLDSDGKLDLVFGKKGAEILRDLNDLAADVYTAPPGSVNFSNTASALRNLFDNLVTYGISGLPVPAREVMGQIGRMLRSRGIRKRVDEAVPAAQPARGGEIKPGVFEPPATPPAAPPAGRGGPSGPSSPPGQGKLFPPDGGSGGAAPVPRKQLLGRAPDIPKLPTPEVIEDRAPRIPVPEVIEGPDPVPAGQARELADAELDAPEIRDWLKAHRFGEQAGADALRVDRAMQIDPEAVQRAATQHAKQPTAFVRAVDQIIERKNDATNTGGTDGGGEGLPRQGGSEEGDQQGQGAGQQPAAEAAAPAGPEVDAARAETERLNREAGETHVAAAMREFEKATAPTGNPMTDALSDKLRTDYSRAVEEYGTLKDAKGGQVLNTDIARELSSDYLQNRTRAAEVHEPASAFIKRLYAERLAGPTPEGKDRRVMFTGGGAGAGKSTAVDGVLKKKVGNTELVYDTNMDKLGSSIMKIEQAMTAGREVTVAYVYANPEDAFQQAMERTMRQKRDFGTGRTVPIEVFVETHVGASRVIRSLADRYRHDLRIEFSFIDNARGKGNAAAVELRDLPVVADNGLREKLEAAAQEAFREGRIDAETLAGFLAKPQPAPRAAAGGSPGVGPGDRGRPERGGAGEPADAVVPRPALPGPGGSQTSVVTERGLRVPVRYRLVEIDDLITSHDNDLRVNPAFPPELQPRDRTRASSEEQIARIANDIQPELLADSPKAADGAPIIGPDGLVESGNARTIALRRAYGMGKTDAYKAWLSENAQRFGLTPEQVGAAKRPMLVRERTADVDRADFARQANEQAVATMSDAEQAKVDARNLPDLEKLETNDDGTINLYRSSDFIRDFMLTVASAADRGRLMTADGKLSQSGVNRIRHAVFSKAYDDPDLVARLAEATDGNTKNVLAGLLRAAPQVARLREMSAAGARGDASFIGDITDAVRRFSDAREASQSVDDYLAQGSLIGGEASPRVAEFMRQLEVDSRAPRRIADWIDGMVRTVDSAGDPRQASLLGEPARAYGARPVTETPEFRRWFGKSKVVDAQGRPQVVYHGTRYVLGPDYRITDQGFEAFKTGGKGRDTSYGPGAYFATNPRQADSFAGAYEREGGGYHPASEHQGGHIYPVYLSLQNPIGSAELVRKFEAQLNGRVVADDDIGPEIGAFARSLGHDGIYIDEQEAWIAFKPEQIKSATGNSGAFDPADPRMTREPRAEYRAGRLVDETGDGEPPAPGQPFLVFRVGSTPSVEGRNAGNAGAVASMLQRMDDYDGPQSAGMNGYNQVAVFKVTVDEPFGQYQHSQFGRLDGQGTAVGRRADRSAVSYSFPRGGGWKAEPLGTVSLDDLRAEAKARHGSDSFDDIGGNAAAQLLRERAAKMIPQAGSLADDLDRQKVYLEQRARAAGHDSVDAFAAADMDGFLRAASEWRDANPAAELREPDPLLTPPTREGLQAAADRAAGVEKADAAEQKRLADKAAADAQRDEFTLTGSNSAADLAAAAGQASLFEQRAAYSTDLFGNPVESPAPRRGALRPVRRETPTDTEALPGDYQERTIVGTETRRKLGAATIKTPADLAAATRHLYKSAVERLDGIVTDAQGKPLAVIGGFKGALSQVAVYPATLVAEAVRVPGAAKLWLSHNHPSGTAELSGADESMEQNIRRVFDGTGIEVEGIAAIAGDRYAFAGGSKYSRDSGNIPAPGAAADVPVIERELVPAAEGKGHSINEPRKAKAAALRYYQAAGNRPGMLLMDAQLKPVAYVPIPTALEGKLKGTGGLRAVYRAISEANAGAAILVHGGELDRSNPRMNVPSIGTNIARALRQIDVNVLDDINVTTGRSRADDGTLAPGGAVWSVAALTAGAGALAMAGQDDDDGGS